MSGRGRLSLAALRTLSASATLSLPPVDPTRLRVGIVHLGIGAFHRAHQAVFTEDALAASGADDWGICAVTQRSASVRDQLMPQDGLYTVLERGGPRLRARVVGAVREVRTAAGGGVAERIADPAVRVVTITVTENGYRIGPDGGLALADAGVVADLAGCDRDGYRPVTVVGQLVAGLRLRQRRHGGGLSVLSCDNLSGNGAVLRRLVRDFCAAMPRGGALDDWIGQAVSFPSCMVDRIVPATRDADRAQVARLLGLDDAAVVVAEPFRQWVIEDDFAAGRPAWEAAGAVLTADVTGYEMVKLRLLNASHSLLAYTGALAGYDTIAEAVADPVLAAVAQRLMVEDAGPTLTAPPGMDLAQYRTAVLRRFANPALGHRTVQVAQDGSVKLPIRLLPVARERLAAGGEPGMVALAVAAWLVYVACGEDRQGRPLPLRDPMADQLRAAFAGRTTPAGLVAAALRLRAVFPADLADNDTFRALLTEHVARLWTGGVEEERPGPAQVVCGSAPDPGVRLHRPG